MRLAILSLGLVAAVGACNGDASTGTPQPAKPRTVELDPAPRAIPLDDTAAARVRASERTLVGRIVEIGPSPGVWSGVVATFQPVVIEVEKRLDRAGDATWPADGTRVSVWFPIVGPPDCDPDEPRLDPRVYRVGARGVVGAEFGPPTLGDESIRHFASLVAESSFHEIADADLGRVTPR